MYFNGNSYFKQSCCSIIFFILLVGCINYCFANDWSSCAYELDRLRRAARDASDAANQADSDKNELENCLNFPVGDDLLENQCQSERSDYQSALSNLNSELDTVRRILKSVESACSVQYSTKSIKQGNSNIDNLCNLYRSYRGSLPIKTLIEDCKKYYSESECKKCLEMK